MVTPGRLLMGRQDGMSVIPDAMCHWRGDFGLHSWYNAL
jgi:hypothetical protein